ncbi:uncharacterized protein LOC120353433 isoform X1 [Nilaparvata lugens]|uniref:uncharacterized protein LOC120353433 isoform X1 n=1 Tax=Nilaparvata lugens TaxID=108931 RepID=UPI00193CBE7D|nr:uncharacterized protein LOC120353433 isoform X1 [Nilaparvata lugens]
MESDFSEEEDVYDSDGWKPHDEQNSSSAEESFPDNNPADIETTVLTEVTENHQKIEPQRTRKRQRQPSKAEKRKKGRNSGLPYIDSKGKNVAGKVFEHFDCQCKKKCPVNINELEGKKIFDSFWKLSSFEKQNVFMCGLISQNKPQNRRPRSGAKAPKSSSNVYRFQVGGTSINVCKQFFLKTLAVSDGRMTRAVKKIRENNDPGIDNRGHHSPANKTSEIQEKAVCDHISSFPSYQSHYTREHNPNRRFLPTNINVTIMYNLYKERCIEENQDPVSLNVYRRIFNNKFNLHFHAPLKDTCNKCDALKFKIASASAQEKGNLEIEKG